MKEVLQENTGNFEQEETEYTEVNPKNLPGIP